MGYLNQLETLTEEWILDLQAHSVLLILSEAEMVAAQLDAMDVGALPILLHTLSLDAEIPLADLRMQAYWFWKCRLPVSLQWIVYPRCARFILICR